jgi:hypothetical protein
MEQKAFSTGFIGASYHHTTQYDGNWLHRTFGFQPKGWCRSPEVVMPQKFKWVLDLRFTHWIVPNGSPANLTELENGGDVRVGDN